LPAAGNIVLTGIEGTIDFGDSQDAQQGVIQNSLLIQFFAELSYGCREMLLELSQYG
jgi:hypothetical protein